MSNIKIGNIGLGAKLYAVDGKEYMLLKEYIDRRISEIVPISEIYIGATPPPESAKVWFDTTEDEVPSSPPLVIPPLSTGYVLSDFGENIINNHRVDDASHAQKCQNIFNYITRDFRDRCTSFITFSTNEIDRDLISGADVLKYEKIIKGDLIFTSYMNAAYWMNYNYDDFVLPVGAHYDNNGQYDNLDGNNRHDITANANTFLANSIAVSARRDTPELFKLYTSYGFGMEFFEDCSKEALDPYYPTKDVPFCFSEIRTNPDGLTVYGIKIPWDESFTTGLLAGEEIWIVYPDGHEERKNILEVINYRTFTVSTPFTPNVVNSFVSASKIINGVLTKFADVSIESGVIISNSGMAASFIDILTIGDVVTLQYPDGHTENVTVSFVSERNYFKTTTQPTLFAPGGIYAWKNDTIGRYINGQAESWATPIVAGKLKVIKMTTLADWDTVRAAARATAKRNLTGIAEIDNSNWDMYRGFGCIDVQAAINYINNAI